MKKIDILAIALSAIICLVAFLTSNNLFIALGVMVVYIAYYFLLARKKIKVAKESFSKVHLCYNFINSFLITLSIKDSLEDAFDNGCKHSNQSFDNVLSQIKEMTINEKIKYLNKYFCFRVYHMFTNVIDIYAEQGGNVLKISESLMNESTKIEETMNSVEANSKKKLAEFAILWALAIAVILFMRFSLSEFYFKMLNSIIFIVLLCIFFLLILVSTHIFLMKYTKLPISEESHE
jgi:hypothetical protein